MARRKREPMSEGKRTSSECCSRSMVSDITIPPPSADRGLAETSLLTRFIPLYLLMLYIFLYDAAEKLGPSSVKAIRSISVIN